VDKFTPQMVSWNGGGFDLPVLHYRGLIHGVVAPRYWDLGDGDYADSRDFKWNNYISRYHTRHLDLMDLLAMYQPRASVPLDELAKLIGFPGKLGMDGSKVWQAWQAGRISEIRDYCETDALNTYLVSVRFRLMRGELSRAEYDQRCPSCAVNWRGSASRTGRNSWWLGNRGGKFFVFCCRAGRTLHDQCYLSGPWRFMATPRNDFLRSGTFAFLQRSLPSSLSR
jgi:hypothetical protein